MAGLVDTPRELLERQARMIRAQAVQQRLDALRSQCRFVVELAEAGIRSRHPDWTPEQVRRDASRRWLAPNDHARWVAGNLATRG